MQALNQLQGQAGARQQDRPSSARPRPRPTEPSQAAPLQQARPCGPCRLAGCHAAPMNDDQLLRYSRHILLDEIGIEGQQRLLAAHALVIGAGGLGSPVALYLGTAGVGRITLVDHDTRRPHQPAAPDRAQPGARRPAQGRIGARSDRRDQPRRAGARAGAARRRRAARRAGAAGRRGARLQRQLRAPATPSTPPAWRTASRWCRARRSASTARSRSTTRATPTRPATPACSRPRPRSRRRAARRWACSRRWWASSARMQAAEALKLLAGVGSSLAGRLLMLDARTMEWTKIAVQRRPAARVRGARDDRTRRRDRRCAARHAGTLSCAP